MTRRSLQLQRSNSETLEQYTTRIQAMTWTQLKAEGTAKGIAGRMKRDALEAELLAKFQADNATE